MNDLRPERLPELDAEQQLVFDRIIEFCEHTLARQPDGGVGPSRRPAVFLLRGAAGTGKSALLSHLFIELSARARERARAAATRPRAELSRGTDQHDPVAGASIRMLVNHAEMWRRYRDLSGDCTALRKAQVLRPTPYINAAAKSGHGADIALVDEGHLLLTRPDPYTRFRGQNQLAEIIDASRITIVVYDDAQVLRMRSHWNEALLEQVVEHASVERAALHRQHRMGASHAVRDWIETVVMGRSPVTAPPTGDQAFDMHVFDDAGAMYRALRRHDDEGSARMLSTYDYPYALDGHDHFIDEPGLCIRWDRYRPDAVLPWPQRPDTVDEVGSVYTVQGLDLDWAGVILGPSVVLGPDGRMRMLPDRYEDRAAFSGAAGLRARGWSDADVEAARERILRDAVLTLLTRARRGLGIYAHDPALAKALLGPR